MAAAQEEETAMLKAGTPQSDESDGTKDKTPDGEKSGEGDEDVIQLKKELGLLEGVAIILGIIIGSGMRESKSATSFETHQDDPPFQEFSFLRRECCGKLDPLAFHSSCGACAVSCR